MAVPSELQCPCCARKGILSATHVFVFGDFFRIDVVLGAVAVFMIGESFRFPLLPTLTFVLTYILLASCRHRLRYRCTNCGVQVSDLPDPQR